MRPDTKNQTTFIYTLSDPAYPERIRYVGCSVDPVARLRQHCRDAARATATRTHKTSWLRSVLAAGRKPTVCVVSEVAVAAWQDAERAYIAHCRNAGCRLTNSTSGGDGVIDLSPDALARRSEAVRRAWTDPVMKLRQADACKRFANTDEGRAAQRDRVAARWASPDARVRQREALRRAHREGRKADMTKPGYRAQRSKIAKRLWADSAYRAKAVAAGLARNQKGFSGRPRRGPLTDEHKANISKAQKARFVAVSV